MNGIPASLEGLAVPVADLRPYSRNARRGDLTVIKESLERHGQYRPVVANRRTSEVLAGNHTLQAAMALGWDAIAVTWVDVDEDAAARIVLVDNRANDLASYELADLRDLLEGLPDLLGTGWTDDALAALSAEAIELPPALAEPDAVPDVPTQPISAPGDVWILGQHRVACGDSTDVLVLDALMAGETADAIWTDPPYGVAYVGKTKDALTIENDGADEGALRELLSAALGAAITATKPGAAWYVAAPHGPMGHAFGQVLGDLGVWKHSLVWVKDVFVLGRADYHYRHEAIFYGWTPGAPRLHPIPDRKQDTVWEIPRPKASREHPTMKPVALIERALENSTVAGEVVLDVFGGSGSTLIACDQLGRRARVIELDPRYVDVICRRYQDATGIKPVLESTGEPQDFSS